MTKQEIEKAIANSESVWINGIEYKLDKYYFIAECNNEPTLYLMTCGYEEDDWNNYPVATITNIYKTKAEAEHYLHHANISRTETLPFLTWEEFNKNTLGFEFTDTIENKYRCHIVRDYRDGEDFIVLYDKNGTISVDEEWEATEENFYKAYDECVRWFRGGNENKELKYKIHLCWRKF